jgi:hypothetical protein
VGNKPPSIHDCIGDAYDAHDVINARNRHKEDSASRGYYPRQGGRYESEDDRPPSPELAGPRVFSRDIRNTLFSARFWQPTNITEYSREMDPELWLDDYRLAC